MSVYPLSLQRFKRIDNPSQSIQVRGLSRVLGLSLEYGRIHPTNGTLPSAKKPDYSFLALNAGTLTQDIKRKRFNKEHKMNELDVRMTEFEDNLTQELAGAGPTQDTLYRIQAYKVVAGQRIGQQLELTFTYDQANSKVIKHTENVLYGSEFYNYQYFSLCEFKNDDRDYGYGVGYHPIMAGSID